MVGWGFGIYISCIRILLFSFFSTPALSYYESNEFHKWEHLYGHTAN